MIGQSANTKEIKDSLKARLLEAIDNIDKEGLLSFRFSIEPHFGYGYMDKDRNIDSVSYFIEYRIVVKDE